MIDLTDYGWDAALDAAFAECAGEGLLAGRVVKQARDRSALITAAGEIAGEVSGRFRHQARGPSDYPAVGDWAAVRLVPNGPALIEAILPRRSAFTRKAAG